MDYDQLKDPELRYFEEILRNILMEDEIQQFCVDFLALSRSKGPRQSVSCVGDWLT